MKKAILKAVVVAFVAAFSAKGRAAIDDSQWHGGYDDAWHVNFDKALAESKRTSRPLFVLRTTTSPVVKCMWCKRFAANVLTTQRFKEFAAKNLVLLMIDDPYENTLPKSQGNHNGLVSGMLDFESNGMPSVVVYTSDGKKLGSTEGAKDDLPAYIASIEAMIRTPTSGLVQDERAKRLFAEGAAKLLAQGAIVPDCGFKSETVGGLTWHYSKSRTSLDIMLAEGEVELVNMRYSNPFVPCIPRDTAGKLEIPEEFDGCKVVAISSQAFWGCSQLASVKFPAGLREISAQPFKHCDKLKAFYVDPGNSNLTAKAGILYSADMSTIVRWPPALPVPVSFEPSVTTIGSNAFASHPLTRLTIPKGIEKIDRFAFYQCRSLKSIAFKGVPSVIGVGAFCETGIKTIVIPEGVVRVDAWAFEGCEKLESVVFPASLRELGGNAVFRNCPNLKKIVFKGDAPYIDQGDKSYIDLFAGANPGSVIYVRPKSKGWSGDGSTKLPARWPQNAQTSRPIKYGN